MCDGTECLCDVVITAPVEITHGFGPGGVLFSERVAQKINPNNDFVGHAEAVLAEYDKNAHRMQSAHALALKQEMQIGGYARADAFRPTDEQRDYIMKHDVNQSAFVFDVHPTTIRGIVSAKVNYEKHLGNTELMDAINNPTYATSAISRDFHLARKTVTALREAHGTPGPPSGGRNSLDWESDEVQTVLRSDCSAREAARRLGVSVWALREQRRKRNLRFYGGPQAKVEWDDPAVLYLICSTPSRKAATQLGVSHAAVERHRKKAMARHREVNGV